MKLFILGVRSKFEARVQIDGNFSFEPSILWSTTGCQFHHSLVAPWHDELPSVDPSCSALIWRLEEIEISIFHSVSLTPRTLHLDWITFSVAIKIRTKNWDKLDLCSAEASFVVRSILQLRSAARACTDPRRGDIWDKETRQSGHPQS